MADGELARRVLSNEHPLQYTWKLYYYKFISGEWEDGMHEVASFKTVEEFWAVFNNIIKPSQIGAGRDYYMFKHNIKPMWEDVQNKKGGRWSMTCKSGQDADNRWDALCMAVVGEQFGFENGEHVCGIVVSVKRQGYKLHLWTNDARNAEMNKQVGSRIKQLCDINEREVIRYEDHESSQNKSSKSSSKFLYDV